MLVLKEFMVKNKHIAGVGIIVLVGIFLVLQLPFSGGSDFLQRNVKQEDARQTYSLSDRTEIKNVILFIGDGMGMAQIAAARYHYLGPKGRLHMERMPVTGFQDTYSADNLVTDSAASGTALASGFKTNNGMISITPDGKKVMSILEACRNNGKSTGLVATSRITHATPAAFAAHVKSRSNEAAIAEQLIKSRVNVIFGGGRDYFMPRSMTGSVRGDDLDLLTTAKEAGYLVVTDKTSMEKSDHSYMLGLFQLQAMTTHSPEPSLAEMSAKAIQLLSKNSEGFFLMVEGSQIDWECHDNESEEALRQLKLFDEAVKIGLDFALADQRTLVIVTGDHETGGMAITGGAADGSNIRITWASGSHTAVPLPLFAFGPGADRFTGLHDNTEIPVLLARLLGIKNFPAEF